MNPGLHLLHKPVGATSFSLVQSAIESVRAARPGQRPRVCHGGALDPFAEGLMILLVGPATRLFDHLHAVPKGYEATVRWGVETDNGDPLGRPVLEGDASGLTVERLEGALAPFAGWRDQVPPATSNKRVGGERAYVRAHRGEAVELPPSRVYLHEATWLGHDLPRESRLRVIVRGGYYVRSLARDLGRALGCGAHLTRLKREAVGPYADPGTGGHVEVRGRDVLPWMPVRVLGDQEVGELRVERAIDAGEVLPPDWRLPEKFPGEEAFVRGLRAGKMEFLLRAEAGRLHAVVGLGAGL